MATDPLSVVALIATVVLARRARRVWPTMPVAITEFGCGVVLGPSLLGLIRLDHGVRLLSALGMAYLLWTSGMQLESGTRRRGQLKAGAFCTALSALIATLAALLLVGVGELQATGVVVVSLMSTLLMPAASVLAGLGPESTDVGELTLFVASLGDLGAVALVSTGLATSASVGVLGLAMSCLLALTVGGLGARILYQRRRPGRPERRWQVSAPAALGAVVLVLALPAAFGVFVGIQAVAAAFFAGVLLSSIAAPSRDQLELRRRIDSVGLGALAPMAFVAAGTRVEVHALMFSAHAAFLVPVLLVAMLVCRAGPAMLLFGRRLGRRRALASGLLLSNKLTLVVIVVVGGRASGALGAASGSALLVAGALSVAIFPVAARRLLADPSPARARPALALRAAVAGAVSRP